MRAELSEDTSKKWRKRSMVTMKRRCCYVTNCICFVQMEDIPLSQWYTVQHLLSNKCCDCCSTNVEQCIMWCWMLKYAIQHVESCWTFLNGNRAWFYSVQQVAACCHLLNDVNKPFFFFSLVSRGLVKRSNMAGWRLGCVRNVMAGLSLGGDFASCPYLLAWRMKTDVRNWGISFKIHRRKFL